MIEERFIRNITGQIYDIENDKFYHEDYHGKPIEYEDEVVKLLNELDEKNKELEQKKNDLKELLTNAKSVTDQKELQKIIYCILIHKIDDKINECKPIDEDNDVWDAETVGRINALKELRKELEGNAHEECFKNSN